MPSALRCPTCSAPLDLPPEHATVTRCTYCGAGVLLTERGGSVQAAAQRLGVHRKTISYRLDKVAELTGLDLSTHDDRLVADLSLYVYRLLAGQPT